MCCRSLLRGCPVLDRCRSVSLKVQEQHGRLTLCQEATFDNKFPYRRAANLLKMQDLIRVGAIHQVEFHRNPDERFFRFDFGDVKHVGDLLDRQDVFSQCDIGLRHGRLLLNLDQSTKLFWANDSLFD